MRKGQWRLIGSLVILLLGSGFFGEHKAKAAISYAGGYYTNLCDSGTSAAYYNCDPGCNPQTGSCTSNKNGVVKWVCQGKWNQCLESESQWGNYEQIEASKCGYTFQLSLFDKKCRREDGSWDISCRLLGYMVWYAGDCWQGETKITPKPTLIPTAIPSPTIIRTVSPTQVQVTKPTAVGMSKFSNLAASGKVTPTSIPTTMPAVKICGRKCNLGVDCQAGFACVDKYCRNPACPIDNTCFCGGEAAASVSAVTKKSPNTGIETWLGMAGMAGIGALGIRIRRWSRKIW